MFSGNLSVAAYRFQRIGQSVFAFQFCLIFSVPGQCRFFLKFNHKVKSIIVTEVTVRSPFVTYSSQNTWIFLDMEVIMIKRR